MKRALPLILPAIPLMFLLVYYQSFVADYAYLDEAHQLWNNHDGSNFNMFLTQGRYLTGKLIEQCFGSINTIADLKKLRLFSLGGWILTTMAWAFLFNRWMKPLRVKPALLILTVVFIITSLPVAISVGWASCLEISLSSLFGLLSGAVIFRRITPVGNEISAPVKDSPLHIPGSSMLTSLIFGLCSLFLYQNSFGFFLLPFLFYYFNAGRATPGRRIIAGFICYLAICAIYYLMVRYNLRSNHVIAESRAGLTTDPLGKVRFFFSNPLPQGFSANYLYDKSNVASQVVAPLLLVLFIGSVFIRFRMQGFTRNVQRIGLTFFFLALIYLPSLVVGENFSSYRTLLPFSLAVFTLLMIQLLFFIRSPRLKWAATGIVCTILIALGYYNYNYGFTDPLKKEYEALRAELKSRYSQRVSTIHFIRPDKRVFREVHGIRSGKDEFGSPSTLRDWVPEPLIRQMVMELTGDRQAASKVTVIQFAGREIYDSTTKVTDSSTLVVDMNQLIRNPLSDSLQD